MSRLAPLLALGGLILVAAAVPATLSAPAAHAQAFSVSHDPAQAPAGAYKLDKRHTSVIVRVLHMGYSNFAMRLNAIDGTLTWDPADPSHSQVDVNVDPKSLETGVPELNKEVVEGLFDPTANPTIHFVSTKVERTGPSTGHITGLLTYHGVTKPIVLDTVFNGTGKAFGKPRLGFSATTTFSQRAFGADKFTQFVSDDVKLDIETEFSK